MLRKLSQSLLIAIAATTAISSAQAQTAANHWILNYSGPHQTIAQDYNSDPGPLNGPLLGGGAYAEAGPGYAWMEGINAVVGAPGYSPGTNNGRLEFRNDRIDFDINTPTVVLLTSEFFFEATGVSNALLSFTVSRHNSFGSPLGQHTFVDRGYAEETGINRTSNPWEITLNPGDYLQIQASTLQVNTTTWDLNLNGIENSGDTFYSRVIVSFGLKIDTDANFTSELGGFYTGAMPLNIPEPSTYALYALLGVFCFTLTTLRRRIYEKRLEKHSQTAPVTQPAASLRRAN